MWWRFLTFCILVTFILFVVLSCIYGRPVVHLFFHRCCDEDIENDQVIFENFGNNFLRERLVGNDIVEVDNGTLFEVEDIERIVDDMRAVLSINDPNVKKWFNNGDIETEILTTTEVSEQVSEKVNTKDYGEVTERVVSENGTKVLNEGVNEDTADVSEGDRILNVHAPNIRYLEAE